MTARHSFTARLMAFVKDRPGQWLPAPVFEQFGRQAWRSRISDARKRFEAAHDGTIENRLRYLHNQTVSEYRYRPEPTAAPSEPYDANAWSLR